MGVLNIRQAERTGARGVFGFAGPSGSGKTLTALYFAWGLACGDASKVGFIDTENRRGSLYADKLVDKHGVVQKFLIADLVAPFSPQRYISAIQEFQAAGVEVLVIDSVTHEWEGTGGCEEIAGAESKASIGWMKAKQAHKRFMNTMLQCDMHIVPCIRAREKTSFKDPKKPVSLGVCPICEKNFMFEMTASVMMAEEGKRQFTMKCPDDLREYLGRGQGYITKVDGYRVRQWIDGATSQDREVESARNFLMMNTEQGEDVIKAHWESTPDNIRFALGEGFKNQLFESAAAFSGMKNIEEDVPSDEDSFEYPVIEE